MFPLEYKRLVGIFCSEPNIDIAQKVGKSFNYLLARSWGVLFMIVVGEESISPIACKFN